MILSPEVFAMYTQLPKLDTTKMLHLPHFPTTYQCVIFRNWGLVPVDRIAKVLGTDVDTVKTAAEAMGLDPQEPVCPDWMTKGYITIIHYNWHILLRRHLHSAGLERRTLSIHPARGRLFGGQAGTFQASRAGACLSSVDRSRVGFHRRDPPNGAGMPEYAAAIHRCAVSVYPTADQARRYTHGADRFPV